MRVRSRFNIGRFLFSVLAEGQALRPTTLLNFPGTVVRSFLKHASHWGVYGDACCGDDTDDVAPWEEDVVRIICIQGKHPGIVVSVSTQDDIFNDLGGSPRGPELRSGW
jgi:hypothetical protein